MSIAQSLRNKLDRFFHGINAFVSKYFRCLHQVDRQESASRNIIIPLAGLVNSEADARALFEVWQTVAEAALSTDPDPIKYILSEGRLNNDPVKIRTRQALRDMDAIAALGWTYAVNGSTIYADKCLQFLSAWAEINVSRGDPIDDTALENALIAYGLVRHHAEKDTKKSIEKWFYQIVEAEIASGKKIHEPSNNWHSHRLKTVGLIGIILQDKKLIGRMIKDLKHHLESNLLSDGSSVDFHHRDALHYHCYDLTPLLTLCIALANAGYEELYDYVTDKGASLRKAVAFLKPYCDGTKTHAEWVHSKVAFDRKRAEAGDPHYKAGVLFEPQAGLVTLELAAYFEPEVGRLIEKMSMNRHCRFTSWRMVLNALRWGGANRPPSDIRAPYLVTDRSTLEVQ